MDSSTFKSFFSPKVWLAVAGLTAGTAAVTDAFAQAQPKNEIKQTRIPGLVNFTKQSPDNSSDSSNAAIKQKVQEETRTSFYQKQEAIRKALETRKQLTSISPAERTTLDSLLGRFNACPEDYSYLKVTTFQNKTGAQIDLVQDTSFVVRYSSLKSVDKSKGTVSFTNSFAIAKISQIIPELKKFDVAAVVYQPSEESMVFISTNNPDAFYGTDTLALKRTQDVALRTTFGISVEKSYNPSSIYKAMFSRFIPVLNKDNTLKTSAAGNSAYISVKQASKKNNTGLFSKFGQSDAQTWLGTRLTHYAAFFGKDEDALKRNVIDNYRRFGFELVLDKIAVTRNSDGSFEDVKYLETVDAKGKKLGNRRWSDKASLPHHLTMLENDEWRVPLDDFMRVLQTTEPEKSYNRKTSILVNVVPKGLEENVTMDRPLPPGEYVADDKILAQPKTVETPATQSSKTTTVTQEASTTETSAQKPAAPFPDGWNISAGMHYLPGGTQLKADGSYFTSKGYGKGMPFMKLGYSSLELAGPFGINAGVGVVWGNNAASIKETFCDMSGFSGSAEGSLDVMSFDLEAGITSTVGKYIKASLSGGAFITTGILNSKVNIFDYAGNPVDSPSSSREFSQTEPFIRGGLEVNPVGKFTLRYLLTKRMNDGNTKSEHTFGVGAHF